MSTARPLRWWLAWRLAIAGVLPLAVVAGLLLGVLLPYTLADVEASHAALGRAISGQIEEHLRSAGRELSAVADYLRQHEDAPASQRREAILSAHAGAGDLFAAIYLASPRDTLVAIGLPRGQGSHRDVLLGIDLSRWGVLREARQRGEPFWSDVFLSAVSGRFAVSLAIPIGEQVLIGEVAIDRLSEFLGSLSSEPRMLTMVLDRHGQIVAHPDTRLSSQQLNLGNLPIVSQAREGRLTDHRMVLNGEEFIATLVSVPQFGWMVLVAEPRGEALRPLVTTSWVLAAGVPATLLLATMATLLLARGIARRIGGYAQQAHALAEGHYEQPWPLSRIRELDSLAHDLDRMSQAIRQRERALKDSEARYRSVISNAPLVIFRFDERGVFLFSEGQGLARAGLTPSQAVGQSLFDRYRECPEICARARRALAGEEQQFVSRIGDVFFDTHFTPLRDASDRLQVIGVALDISERVRAEEELRQANLVVENSPAMLFRWRAEAGWPTVFASRNVKQLGYSPEDLVESGLRFASLIHPEDLERVASDIDSFVERGIDHFEQEYRLVCRDGSVRWVDDHTAVERDRNGKVTHYQGIVIDISERRQAEDALRRANRQLRMIGDCNQALSRATDETGLLGALCRIIVEAGGYGMARVDSTDGRGSPLRRVASAGDVQGRTQGTSVGDAGGGEESDSLSHADGAFGPRQVAGGCTPGACASQESGFRCASLCVLPIQAGGQRFGVLTIYAARPDAFDSGELALLDGLAGDLAFGIVALRTRKQRDEVDVALRESEARYRLLFDSNPQPMWVFDRRTLAFLTVNDAAVATYGYTREELLGMSLADLNPGEETPLLSEDVVAVEEASDYTGFWRHLHRNGTIIDVDIVAHPISYQGCPAELVLANDVTERKRAERALLESEIKYRELVENANSIILRLNPEGRITFINEFGLKFFDYPEADLLGRPALGTIVPLDGDDGQRRLSARELSLNPERFEHQISENMRRSGERVWVAWTNKAILDDQGQLVEVFSVGSDITERKRVEEELARQREHLEERVVERTSELRQAMAQLVQAEKLAALGNLVAGVAHELNTPLGNARVAASVLAEQWSDFTAAVRDGKLSRSQLDRFLVRGREAIDLLERNSARAAELIGHFKQVAADQSSARRRTFDLQQTVQEMLVTLRLSFRNSEHRIDVDIPPGLEMDSYPGPLEQIITNLISNALTHGLAGVESGKVELQARPQGEGQVVLRCRDDGVGIPKAILSRIFEPFFTTRLGQGGSGLGLYIVYNLVTSVLGGTIEVVSTPREGATFTLVLPRVAPERSPAAVDDESPGSRSTGQS
ncbi:PAS domain S-box protein [Accumulibacter sp.]|uniref:PAS domain S-box protein n=1 Tax=Accumulibacter sp. TaxID=2053492 RepID=UPI0025F17D80|nr:PAS domain S-box protein [Accumulibacter sp.]MCM8594106.1 PAS domain S-box protein [Accumulibacter sp.]MDS4048249.1 PAS domain S-box protein [Accumulibacter sp.]